MKPLLYASVSNGKVYELDLDTGKATLVANTGQGLELACHNNTLYGLTVEVNSRLLKYDPSSKQFVNVGNTGIPQNQLQAIGMAGHPTKNSLYVVTTNKLFEINAATGAGREVASFTSGLYGSASIAITPDGKAYMTTYANRNQECLATVNLSTGVITNIGVIQPQRPLSIAGLVFHEGMLYGLGTNGQLSKIDPNTAREVSTITTDPVERWGSLGISPVYVLDSKPTNTKPFVYINQFIYSSPGQVGYGEIYQLDLDTGKTTLVAVPSDFLFITCHNNTLYGLTPEPNAKLLKYDPSLWEFITVGNTTLPESPHVAHAQLAGDPTQNKLYIILRNELFEIDPTTGATKKIGDINNSNTAIAMNRTAVGLTINPNGQAYTIYEITNATNYIPEHYLASVNLSTGVITTIRQLEHDTFLRGIMFYGGMLYTVGFELRKIDLNTGKTVSNIPIIINERQARSVTTKHNITLSTVSLFEEITLDV